MQTLCNAVRAKPLGQTGKKLPGNGRVHKAYFLGVADAGTAGFCVLDDVQCFGKVGSVVYIDMADAGAGLDTGHLGVLHAGTDEPCTAARDQQIHIAYGGHQSVGRGMGGVLDQADRSLGQTGLFQALPQNGDDGVGTAPGLLAAAQDAGVAAFDGKGGGIAGHVWTALVDDGDHTHRHGGLFNHKAVGALYPVQHPAHRVGQGGNLVDALRHGFDARNGQGQTIQHHIADVPFGSSHVLGVGGKDGRLVLRIAQSVRHAQQGSAADSVIGQCKGAFGAAGRFQNLLCRHRFSPPCGR